MAFLFITENFYLLVVLYEALKPITDFRSYLIITPCLLRNLSWNWQNSRFIALLHIYKSSIKAEIFFSNASYKKIRNFPWQLRQSQGPINQQLPTIHQFILLGVEIWATPNTWLGFFFVLQFYCPILAQYLRKVVILSIT